MHFVGLCSVIIVQCRVQKKNKICVGIYNLPIYAQLFHAVSFLNGLPSPDLRISFLTRAYRTARPSYPPWCGYRNGISWGTRIVKLLIMAVFPSLPLRALARVRRNIYWHRNFVINCLTKLYSALLSARPCRRTAEWRYCAINSWTRH